MNKRTRAIDEETYKLIIATMKNGFTHEGVQYKPNERIATVLVLEYNLGLRVGDILNLSVDSFLHEKKASGKVLLSFRYDLNGNKVQQSNITGKSMTYTYNALDLLEEIRDNGFSAKYQYHSNGTIKSLSVGDKLITHYEYDKDKNLTRQWTKMAGEVEEDKRIRLGIPTMDNEKKTLLADYHYSYDGNGNRISKEALTGKTSYQYDTLNRLVKVQYPKGIEEFTYDKADNRIRRLTEEQEELYKYDVCNRLVEKQTRRLADNSTGNIGNMETAIHLEKPEIMKPQVRQANLIPFQTSTFQYDNQGNLLREERKTGENRQESIYSYDGFNRQKKIVNFENKVQVNHYDGEGLRHEMEENGNLVKFLYADREVVAEEKTDGNIIRFIRGYDLVASDSESARTYYHYACDEQGSITHVLGEDRNGEYALKNYYEYGAFGDFKVKEEEVENRFGYNGEIFDPISGQYYLRARYYNPVIGRFTQEDTYYGDGLNLYAYCRNLPIGYEDPSGHICEEKARKLEEKEKNRTLTKEEYKELHRYRRENKSGTYSKDFEDLAVYRREQGMPIAGSIDDKYTAGKLRIGNSEYYGRNGHGKHNEVKNVFTVNPQTATHAEGDVFYQAKMAGETSETAVLITDRRACRACGYNGGIRSMAKQMGITDLTIVSPGYEPIRFNPQEKPVPNPFK